MVVIYPELGLFNNEVIEGNVLNKLISRWRL